MSVTPILLLALGMVGAVVGSNLLRERRDRQAVEGALFPEVVALRRQAAAVAIEITRRHQASEPFDSAFFVLWPLSEPLVYPAAGAQALGRLSGEALDRVGYFHAQLADARVRLAEARVKGCFEPSPYRILSCLVRSYNHVEPWLRKLQPRLDDTLYDWPDMSEANELLGTLEDMQKEPLAVAYSWVDCGAPDDASSIPRAHDEPD